jgi:2-amino-4-hydroxy-6-hydroxymethyldihydropteridine diphosphokinase
MQRVKVYLGIGSNIGDRKRNCLEAVEALKKAGVLIRRVSSLYETEPWGYEKQPRFLNMAVEGETELSPLSLLKKIKEIEQNLGRQESFRWGPREVDIDILFYDSLVVNEPGLKIPHPYIHKREFVLRPLKEIAPELVHPVLGETIIELFEQLKRE